QTRGQWRCGRTAKLQDGVSHSRNLTTTSRVRVLRHLRPYSDIPNHYIPMRWMKPLHCLRIFPRPLRETRNSFLKKKPASHALSILLEAATLSNDSQQILQKEHSS